MPVDPEVPSYIVSPEYGVRMPLSSAWDSVSSNEHDIAFINAQAQLTISIILSATRSFELWPAPFKN